MVEVPDMFGDTIHLVGGIGDGVGARGRDFLRERRETMFTRREVERESLDIVI